MLRGIKLINFKSFVDLELPMKKLTLLAGLNNCGKSSVLQAMRMLWKFVQTGDPSLPGYGHLREIKNSKISKSANMEIQCDFDDSTKTQLIANFDHGQKVELTQLCQGELPLLAYLSADRLGPRVSLPLNTTVDVLTNVGEQGEYVIDFLSRHERDIVPEYLRHPKAEGETLEYNVRAWLREISPNVVFNHGVDRKRDSSYAEINDYRPTNTGYGLSYSLPIITLILGLSSQWVDDESQLVRGIDPVILLENPEAHLHPQGQTAMGRLMSLAAASGVQIVVETHSDHVMDGIRIALKQGDLDVSDCVFHYFTLTDMMQTEVETPIIHQNGKLSSWPDGFFDQTMKNRAVLAKV